MPTQQTTPDPTVAQLAAEAGVGRHTIYNAINAGRLRAYRLTPKTTRVPREDWEKFRRGEFLNETPAH